MSRRWMSLFVSCALALGLSLVLANRAHAMWKLDPKCSASQEPDFETDTSAWFDWFDDCASGPDQVQPPPPPPPPCHSHRFKDSNGHCWVVVCTPDGPMIQPCWDVPISLGKLVIFGVKATQFGNSVLLRGEKGYALMKVPRKTATLRQLVGLAAAQRPLPSSKLSAIPRAFWESGNRVTYVAVKATNVERQ